MTYLDLEALDDAELPEIEGGLLGSPLPGKLRTVDHACRSILVLMERSSVPPELKGAPPSREMAEARKALGRFRDAWADAIRAEEAPGKQAARIEKHLRAKGLL